MREVLIDVVVCGVGVNIKPPNPKIRKARLVTGSEQMLKSDKLKESYIGQQNLFATT